MPRGYRLLIIASGGIAVITALGVGAFFGSLYGPDRKQYETVAGDNAGQNDYQGPSQSLPDIAGLPSPVERSIANPRPQSGQDHEKRDLAAQEASALWAFWMVLASFLSVLITAVGTIFLYKQIVLTREAVEDTGKATVAMNRQNEIAEAAQRPWLDAKIEMVGIAKGSSGYVLCMKIFVENVGNTPANQLRYDIDGWFFENWDDEKLGINEENPIKKHVRVLAQKIIATLQQKPLDGLTVFPRSTVTVNIEREVYARDHKLKRPGQAWLVVGLRYSFGDAQGSTVKAFCVRAFDIPKESGFDFVGDIGDTYTKTKAIITPWESGGHVT